MKNLIQVLTEIRAEKIETSERAGEPIIQTTKRTEIKNRVENAFLLDLEIAMNESDLPFIVGETVEGIVLAIEHDDLVEKGGDVVGEIPFQFEIKVKNLNYDTSDKIEEQAEEKEIKAEEKRQAEIAKQAKIKADKIKQDQKKKEKELQKTMKNLKATE